MFDQSVRSCLGVVDVLEGRRVALLKLRLGAVVQSLSRAEVPCGVRGYPEHEIWIKQKTCITKKKICGCVVVQFGSRDGGSEVQGAEVDL